MTLRSTLLFVLATKGCCLIAQDVRLADIKTAIVEWEHGEHPVGDTVGIDLLNDLTVMYMMRGWADSCLLTSSKAMSLGEGLVEEAAGNPMEMRVRKSYGSALDLGTDLLLGTNDPVAGVERARQALRNAEMLKDTDLIRKAYHNLARGFRMLGFDSLALSWHDRYMELLQGADSITLSSARLYHAGMLHSRSLTDSALVELRYALRLNNPYAAPLNHLDACFAAASIFLQRDMPDSARHYVGIARQVLNDVPGAAAFQQWDLVEAQLELRNGDPGSALRRSLYVDSIGRANGDASMSGEALRLQAIAYGMLQRPVDALKSSYEMARNVRREYGVDKVRRLAWAQSEMAHQRELELRAAEIMRKKQSRDMALAGLGAALVVAMLLVGLVVQARRNSGRLAAANAELTSTQARLVQAEHERAAEVVRTRIARDIHDDVGGELTRLALISDELKARLDAGFSDAPVLDRLADGARRISALMSDVVWAVDPGADSARDLVERVRTTAARLVEGSSVVLDADLRADEPGLRLAPDVKRDIHLLVKEALNNALKYAGARRFELRLHLHGAGFTFRLADDGVGYQGPREGGRGLKNMQERAISLGGTLEMSAPPSGGMVIGMNGVLDRSRG